MGVQDGVVYWHMSDPEAALTVQSSLLMHTAFLGMLSWDIFKSLPFDIELLWSTFRGPRWYEPIRLSTRLIYFATRISGFFGLLLVVLFVTETHADCAPWRNYLLPPGCIVAVGFSAIFALRAYVMSQRDWRYGLFLLCSFCTLTVLCLFVFFNFGEPVRVPGSQFCIWKAPVPESTWVRWDHVYAVYSAAFDLAILLITLHKLVEGGLYELLTNVGTFVRQRFGFYRGDDPELAWGALSIKLVEQGVGLYAVNEVARLVFVIGVIILPEYQMPVFIRGALICGFHPIILRMLLEGQAKLLNELPQPASYAFETSRTSQVKSDYGGPPPSSEMARCVRPGSVDPSTPVTALPPAPPPSRPPVIVVTRPPCLREGGRMETVWEVQTPFDSEEEEGNKEDAPDDCKKTGRLAVEVTQDAGEEQGRYRRAMMEAKARRCRQVGCEDEGNEDDGLGSRTPPPRKRT